MADNNFPKGLIFKKPHDNAPSFVKGALSIKVSEFTEWAKENEKNGWVNLDLKESKEGKYYASINTYQKPENNQTERQEPSKQNEQEEESSDLPF